MGNKHVRPFVLLGDTLQMHTALKDRPELRALSKDFACKTCRSSKQPWRTVSQLGFVNFVRLLCDFRF